MDYELPTEFDIIIVGTGIVESVIAAAASRIGKRVLHIDSNNFYGGLWASFNLESIQQLNNLLSKSIQSTFDETLIKEGEKVEKVGNNLFKLENLSNQWHIPEKLQEVKSDEETEVGDVKEKTWCKENLIKESRRFNIDLTPKLQFARGDFVELLISSNIARYSEYRSVSRVLTWLNGQLEVVPCSRSDVFANNRVSVIEKRMLMKLFNSINNENNQDLSEYENKTFKTFLKDKKLTPDLIHYVLYAISMSTDETSCFEGIERTKRFLNSLGRFGKTPFLFSMYGSGEITQAFCRLSAVFGGVYALNQKLNGLIFDCEDKFRGIICGKQRINAEILITSVDNVPEDLLKPTKNYISRAVFITDKSIMESEKEHLTLLLYPPENEKNSCVILEMGTLTGTCPKDLYVVHMISRQSNTPKLDFQHCVNNLFGLANKPNILWSSYFSIPDSNDLDLRSGSLRKFHVCPGPDLDLDYDQSIKKAKDIFNEIYPDLEFLPRAPDPEEIVIEGEESTENATDQENCDDDNKKNEDNANSSNNEE